MFQKIEKEKNDTAKNFKCENLRGKLEIRNLFFTYHNRQNAVLEVIKK